ncbi:hypothetical protein [Mastigocoleus sp. MO_188.B34]|nr:hypothetical protein [Mastigocoleus sp. MO_188.B34]MDJ0693514.1 hypothetical protein [Mastigocoleus sp. MO_188.B34]
MSTKLSVQPEEPPPDFPLLAPYLWRTVSHIFGGNGRGGPPGYG